MFVPLYFFVATLFGQNTTLEIVTGVEPQPLLAQAKRLADALAF
jgi:hypothetical protein